ncbi:MAG: class II fructose-1,6-bisphosphate aldolase [Patescibacteria group bacterium]|nr:class II fructose-1,6-bisphosphate aldolase [Patescibacteria group bacterium]
MLTTNKKILAAADKGGYAVGAFNVNNLEIIQAVIETAVEEKSPVIIQTSEGAIEYAGMDYLLAMAKIAAKAPVPMSFHLDHGKDLKVIKRAIDAGYTSVMFDGSVLPYKENVAKTKQVVAWAKKKGVSVEAEIGAIKGVEDLVSVSEKQAFFTDPDEAARFTKATGCDALAISIGTAHGAFKSKTTPELDISRLKKIDALVKVPLVLHGASGVSPAMVERLKKHADVLQDGNRLSGAVGIPDEQIKAAIRNGIRKINIDSDLRLAFTAGVRETVVEDHKTIDPRKWLALSKSLMKETVRGKMRLFGSSGKA